MANPTISIDRTAVRPSERLLSYAERVTSRYARDRIEAILTESGIRIDGAMPWDPEVHDERVFRRVLKTGMLAIGEAYVDGDWDCTALDELATRFARLGIDQRVGSIWRGLSESLIARFVNRQGARAAVANGRAHYDLGDDLYAAMLGSSMVYSCGYWHKAANLDEAQRAKHELVCAKLDLRAGHTLLDIGCGYGELARYVAAEHGIRVVGVTVSRNQARHARRRCAGLPVEICEQDYRSIHGRFDRIVSLGMFEHVGSRNYERFFTQVRRLLAPDGLFLLHTVGNWRDAPAFDPWLDRYVFPGVTLPSAVQLAKAIDGKLVIEDWQNFGADYDRTLLAWHSNFERAWPSLEHYGPRFRRMWRYYLLMCAGAFRARRNQLWQLVLSPDGHRGGYRRPLM
jgi:cyclopropane-fatty-acyl-phospholipid synthase